MIKSTNLRAALLASAGLCLALAAGTARAEGETGPGAPPLDGSQAVIEAQSSVTRVDITNTEPDPQILIANPNTTVTARDPNNITGIGQMVTDAGGGFVGLCTGSLINPRTVIFAAHCVNDQPANTYGYANGGTGIGFGFSNFTQPAIVQWLQAIGGNGQTNVANAFYNSNWVTYHPASTEPNAAGFLYGDVAMASLDTPATDIPTWAMLFSALPATNITAAGSGYNVTIAGYGNTGTGETGATASGGFRRRLAENIIGGLASLDQFENFLFGGNSTTNPQNLYWIDFDDPRRGTPAASPFDFNAWRDNSVASGKEGITSQGDSGGPLILNGTNLTNLFIGVLSGGYTRFFNGQPANSYGTAAFYQPLYLYWDWVAANNPYHYVSAKAGNGSWTDPTHWVTNLDPNYMILGPNGQVINGIPTDPGQGPTGNTGTWGQACFQSGGVSDCLDMATGVETVELKPIGTGDTSTAANNLGTARITADGFRLENVGAQAQAGGDSIGTLALPAATLANGLPGASNFVPNNSNGDPNQGVKPAYFDVALTAAGTTTLNSAVTVDQLRMNGVNTGLDIQANGSLTSLVDYNQIIGTTQVNGTLTVRGDYFMLAGGLNGSGTINTPFYTNVMGVIAPGTAGTIGTLTFNGNIILASASTLLIDLGVAGPQPVSDSIVVNKTTPGSGGADIGGDVILNFTRGLTGDATYTILTADHRTGLFDPLTTGSSAILTSSLLYGPTTVKVNVKVGLYRSLFTNGTQEYQFAQLLDQNRALAATTLESVYLPLDQQNAATIRGTLTGLLPATETTVQSLGIAGVDNTASFIRNRLDSLDTDSLGGTIAHYGTNPVQVAALSWSNANIGMAPPVRTDAVAPMQVEEGKLPETMSAFFAGGYLNGDSAPMVGAPALGRDNFDGWYAAAGLEGTAGDGVIGLALSYTNLDGESGVAGQIAKADLYQGTLYGKVPVSGLTLDAQFSAGIYNAKTRRDIAFLGTPFTLRSSDRALALNGEVGLGKSFEMGGFKLTPRAAGRFTKIDFSLTQESGGPLALVYDRNDIRSIQGRGGLTFEGTGPTFKPYLNATYVHEFKDRAGYVGTNIAGGIPGFAAFNTNATDKNYGEVSAGVTWTTGTVDLSLHAQTSIFRKDIEAQSYSGSVSFRF